MAQGLLAAYSLALFGISIATWLFAFETRKTFKGGIFWNGWRFIATSLLLLGANQIVVLFEAIYGFSDTSAAVDESFVAAGALMLLAGFYLFYKAWNPRALRAGS
ncbi:MAG TPA: hypothetical protein VFB30_04305 [Spirochaetia bacterium]|nr:hypothetical protein [Spirochaetia bacterium]